MAGFETTDGKLRGNRQMVERYDESKGQKSKHLHGAGKDGAEKELESSDGGGHEEIKQVVQEHGPANKVEVHHDHEGGSHKVVSHHGSHRHEAEHGSAAMAHAHAAHAAGVSDSDELHEAHSSEMPEDDRAEAEEKAEEEISPGIHSRANFME